MQIHPAADRVAVTDHPSAGVIVRGDHELSWMSPDGSPLWLVAGALPAGSAVEWSAGHGDEAVYVVAGSLEVNGRPCPTGSAIIVEAGAHAVATVAVDTEVVHVGGGEPERPSAEQVVVVGAGGTYARVDEGQNVRFFADATSPSCSLWFLYSERHARHDSPTHSHTKDELIHLLRGELVLGAHRVRPGDTLFVEADRRYRFHSGDDGYAFLNYRAGPSVMTVGRDDPPLVENGASTGMAPVGDAVVV